MFFHLYTTRIKCLLKDKSLFFWSLIFPIVLGTLFKAGFGDILTEQRSFDTIPVAFVSTEGNNNEFYQIMSNISTDNDKLLFLVTQATQEEAIQLLDDKTVDGIIIYSDNPELIVKKSGISSSILKSFIDQYQQNSKIIQEISTNKPEALTRIIADMNSSLSILKEVSLGGESINSMFQYFYALIAMTCITGCFYGLKNSQQTQANQSPIGARRSITPTHKLTLIITETFSAITLHFSEIVIVYLYLLFVLKIPIGKQPALFLLSCFVGCLIGISLGQFIGALSRWSEQTKSTLLNVITMGFSFLSGLMVANVTDWIEKNIPIINRINPTTLLTNAFYCLTIYDDYKRFLINLVSLTVMAVLLSIASFFATRREKYASI